MRVVHLALTGRGVVHHLLDLRLLLRQPLDVGLQVLEGVVHVLEVARVAVHVAAVGGRGGLVAAQPPALHRRQVVGDVLQKWDNRILVKQFVLLVIMTRKPTVPGLRLQHLKGMQVKN